MERYLDFFFIALAVGLALALAYNVHKYGLDPTLTAITKALGIAEQTTVTDAEALWAKIEGLFTTHTATIVAATSSAIKAAVPASVPPAATAAPAAPALLAGDALQAAVNAAEAAIQAWLAPAINYALVTAAELTVIYTAALAASSTTTMDYTTGAVIYPAGGSPVPNFAIQGKFLVAWLHPGAGFPMPTEAERAYVGYNNDTAGGIGAHFIVAANGTVTAR